MLLVLGGIGAESDSAVVRTLIRQVEATVLLYVAPEHRAQAERYVADGFERLLRAAAAGSDAQLQFARAFAQSAVSAEHLDVVAGLLDGSRPLPGLEIDTDLRWGLLHPLVASGRVGEDAIERELARDETATGKRHAASARAALPTMEAKQAAWAAVVGTDDLPNALQTATIGGFSNRRHRALLAAFVEPYFDALSSVWATRTNETAQNVVTGLYPTLLSSPDLLARTDAWLASADPVPALRRLVEESRDGVARALRAQERDAQAP